MKNYFLDWPEYLFVPVSNYSSEKLINQAEKYPFTIGERWGVSKSYVIHFFHIYYYSSKATYHLIGAVIKTVTSYATIVKNGQQWAAWKPPGVPVQVQYHHEFHYVTYTFFRSTHYSIWLFKNFKGVLNCFYFIELLQHLLSPYILLNHQYPMATMYTLMCNRRVSLVTIKFHKSTC